MNEHEEGAALTLDFEKLSKLGLARGGVIPVAIQNADTREMLYVAYVNALALEETLKTQRAVLWSTSRNELWRKGESSGDVLDLVEVRVNCEQNSLLYLVRPRGGVCHTRDADGSTRPSCYYRRLVDASTLENA